MSTVTNIVILSHEKEHSFVEEIKQHLRSAYSSIFVFNIADIQSDEEPILRINEELHRSQVSLILISSHLMADDVLLKIRKLAIELHDEDKLETIQILIKSVYDYGVESKRKVYTVPEIPIIQIKDKDSAYTEIIRFIFDKAENIILKAKLALANDKIKRLTSTIEKLIS